MCVYLKPFSILAPWSSGLNGILMAAWTVLLSAGVLIVSGRSQMTWIVAPIVCSRTRVRDSVIGDKCIYTNLVQSRETLRHDQRRHTMQTLRVSRYILISVQYILFGQGPYKSPTRLSMAGVIHRR